MKKKIIPLCFFLSLAIFSCNTKNSTSDETTVAGTDSSMMQKDNTSVATTPVDTNTAVMNNPSSVDTAASATAVKPNPAKKGKKGKVVINMATSGTGDMTADKEGYYSNTEILPAYPGGQKALEKFFANNIQYPADASDNGIEGTVNINFAVDENGKIYSPKITSPKLGYGLEEEALAAFNKMPKWTPGRIKGKNVKTKYTLPVNFTLAD